MGSINPDKLSISLQVPIPFRHKNFDHISVTFFLILTASGFECNGETINFCKRFASSWKVYRLDWDELHLSDCKQEKGPLPGDDLLLFVSRGKPDNYGKYGIVTVKLVTSKTDNKG